MDQLFRPLEGPDVRVRLDRQDDMLKKWVFHGYLNQEEARDATIAEKFGGGTYRAQLTQRDPTSGSFRIQGTKVITIPGQYKPPQQVVTTDSAARGRPTETNAPAVERVAPVSPNEILSQALVSQVLDVMKVKQDVAPRFDWGPIILAGLGVVREVLASRSPAAPTAAPGESAAMRMLVQQLDEMRAELRMVRNQPPPAVGAVQDTIGSIKQLLELRELLGGGRSDDDKPESDSLVTLGTKIMEMLQGMPRSAVVPAGASPVPAPARVVEVSSWTTYIRQVGPFLVSAAQEAADPEDVAQSVASLVPARYVAIVDQFVRQPNAAGLLMQQIPALAEHGEWVNRFLKAMQQLGQEEDATDDDGPDDDDSGHGMDTSG